MHGILICRIGPGELYQNAAGWGPNIEGGGAKFLLDAGAEISGRLLSVGKKDYIIEGEGLYKWLLL